MSENWNSVVVLLTNQALANPNAVYADVIPIFRQLAAGSLHLVPASPTRSMVYAGQHTLVSASAKTSKEQAINVYKAMIKVGNRKVSDV